MCKIIRSDNKRLIELGTENKINCCNANYASLMITNDNDIFYSNLLP